MKNLKRLFIVFSVAGTFQGSSAASEINNANGDQRAHGENVKALVAPHIALLANSYPGYEAIIACKGDFTGSSNREIAVALRSLTSRQGDPVRRGAIIFVNGEWKLHKIDEELLSDSSLSRASHIDQWQPSSAQIIERRAMRCAVDVGTDRATSANGKVLGRKPFFSLLKTGRGVASNICFASSEQYNNWDCVAFDPKQGRFRLWYQQVFAD